MPEIIETDETTITLKLSHVEAAAVAMLCGAAGGSRLNSPKRHFTGIHQALLKENPMAHQIELIQRGFSAHVDIPPLGDGTGLFMLAYPPYDMRYIKMREEVDAAVDMVSLVSQWTHQTLEQVPGTKAWRGKCHCQEAGATAKSLHVVGQTVYCTSCKFKYGATTFMMNHTNWSKWRCINYLALSYHIPLGVNPPDESEPLMTPEQKEAYIKEREAIIVPYIKAEEGTGFDGEPL